METRCKFRRRNTQQVARYKDKKGPFFFFFFLKNFDGGTGERKVASDRCVISTRLAAGGLLQAGPLLSISSYWKTCEQQRAILFWKREEKTLQSQSLKSRFGGFFAFLQMSYAGERRRYAASVFSLPLSRRLPFPSSSFINTSTRL